MYAKYVTAMKYIHKNVEFFWANVSHILGYIWRIYGTKIIFTLIFLISWNIIEMLELLMNVNLPNDFRNIIKHPQLT